MPEAIVEKLVRSEANDHAAFLWTYGDQRNITIMSKHSHKILGYMSHRNAYVYNPCENKIGRAADYFSSTLNAYGGDLSIVDFVFRFSGQVIVDGSTFIGRVSGQLNRDIFVFGRSRTSVDGYPPELEQRLAGLPRVIDDRATLDSMSDLLARVSRGGQARVARFLGPDRVQVGGPAGRNKCEPYHIRYAQAQQRRAALGGASSSLPAAAAPARGGRVSDAGGDAAPVLADLGPDAVDAVYGLL